jgi:hypothetical protein
MAQTPAGWRTPRRWLLVVLVGFLLPACDLRPFPQNADLPMPVETVTAVEVDVDDLIVDKPSPSRERSVQHPRDRPADRGVR